MFPDTPNAAPQGLEEMARLAAGRGRPPVERWDPPHCGHSAMCIRRDGSWIHEGRPIRRPELVRLFASILRREPDGSFALVTPVEKLTIDVEDTPFLATALVSDGLDRERRIGFRLNDGGFVIAGPDHPLRLHEGKEGPRPVIALDRGLEARLVRPVYYELVEMMLDEGHEPPGLWSQGCFFAVETHS